MLFCFFLRKSEEIYYWLKIYAYKFLYRAVFSYDNAQIICAGKGKGFDDFKGYFADDERAFGYIRIQMGDEMSKRNKFLFLTWIGPSVGVMQRAKMSTDKSLIKDVITVSVFPFYYL